MWLDGHALYAVLKMPAAWMPEFWNESHLPMLALLNYATLVFEPLFALLVFLPTRHGLKYLLGGILVFFHLL